jgi:hypothetical protein
MLRGVIQLLANRKLIFQGSTPKMTFQVSRFVECKGVGVAAWNNLDAPRPASAGELNATTTAFPMHLVTLGVD